MLVTYRNINNCEAESAAELEKLCLHTCWTKSQIENLPENACYLAAFCQNELCGILSAYFVLDEVQIMNLAVLPQYRKMGIAAGLLEKLFDLSAANGCKFVTLEVGEDNFPAISLYEKCGFTAVGKRKNFYGNISAILMEKIL